MKKLFFSTMCSLLISTIVFGLDAQTKLPSTFSKYTPLTPKECATLDSSDFDPNFEIDYYSGICPSFGGYGVTVEGGDLRYDVSLSYGGKKINSHSDVRFHSPGSKAEWLFQGITDPETNRYSVKLVGFVHRIYAQDIKPDGTDKNVQELEVYRLNGDDSCLIGRVKQVSKMNQKARDLVYSKNTKCLHQE
jgi:hypothetical protein